jgi:hypothetical protein
MWVGDRRETPGGKLEQRNTSGYGVVELVTKQNANNLTIDQTGRESYSSGKTM